MDNDEIRVGDYIRNKDGYIDKVERIVYDELEKKNYYACEKSVMASGFKEDIVKHSKNIINLIEVGDVLKLKDGTKWEVQEHQGSGNWLQLEWENIDDNEDFFKKVDSVVTKEQFQSVEFRLEE